ncbi:MAG: hypothetical protein Tsb002_19390 [Wenzhouxiangellaceae bacterium]
MRNIIGAIILLVSPVVAWAGPPDWFMQHIQVMTAAGGVWHTSNEQYHSEQEPARAYVVEWKPGIGGHSLIGRMYGVFGEGEDARNSSDFWQFRLYWDEEQQRVIALQFAASGAVGRGPMIQVGDDMTRMDQVFHGPDGAATRIGHEMQQPTPEIQLTRSYDIQADGSWQPRREYRWHHQPQASH